ncbi:MAG: GMC family oxidoreductase [bacterium]|nr:GMC family oxidoreductase [bacterium]
MSMKYDRYDAVIIGSGFGGSAAAYTLSKAGLKTLLIEKGDWAKRDEADWEPREILIDKRYKCEYPVVVKQFGDTEFRPAFHNEIVGGNSVFYGGVSIRMRETDFDLWPIKYSDLEPYYTKAENLLEISGKQGDDPFEPNRSGPYPYEPIPLSKPAERINKAAEKLGYSPFRIPLALNFHNNERTICEKCNKCDGFPCKIHAKNDTSVVLLKKALEFGLEIMPNNIGARFNLKKGKIDSVECINKTDRQKLTISADKFILSAGSVQSPAVLLRSGLGKFENNRLVGRYLMRHCGGIITGLFPYRTNPGDVFHKQICISNFYEDLREELGSSVGLIQDIYTPASEVVHYYAPRHLKTPAKIFSRMAQNLLCIAEDESNIENRISLSNKRDGYGLELLKIEHAFSKNDYRKLKYLTKKAKKVLKKAGAVFTLESEIDKVSPPSFSHAVGTVRFGDSPVTSVLDSNCKYFGLDNLFVIDGSFMPTSSGVNPSLTIAANSLRVADYITTSI